jgi:hypothetical protein
VISLEAELHKEKRPALLLSPKPDGARSEPRNHCNFTRGKPPLAWLDRPNQRRPSIKI